MRRAKPQGDPGDQEIEEFAAALAQDKRSLYEFLNRTKLQAIVVLGNKINSGTANSAEIKLFLTVSENLHAELDEVYGGRKPAPARKSPDDQDAEEPPADSEDSAL